MAILHVYIYTIAILVCKSNAENIHYGNMCLESASNFWNVESRCTIKESKIKEILQNANTTCPKMCEFTMSSWHPDGALGLIIQLKFNGNNESEVVEACSSQSKKFMTLYINCSSWNEGPFPSLMTCLSVGMLTM